MAVEDSDSNFGTTVRAFAFNGDDTKFRSWEGKTLALASSKGFMLALTRGETVPGLTVEQYEYGEVEEPVRLIREHLLKLQVSQGLLRHHLCEPVLRPRWRTGSTWHARPRGLT